MVRGWIDESVTLAKYFVYTIGPEGTGSSKPTPSPAYRDTSKEIARHRVALGGYRLAALLNDKLK